MSYYFSSKNAIVPDTSNIIRWKSLKPNGKLVDAIHFPEPNAIHQGTNFSIETKISTHALASLAG